MSKERDLLVSCLDEFQYHEVPCSDLIRTIQWLLNEPEQTEQEPVVWMYEWVNEIGEHVKGIVYNFYDDANLIPLYTAPPKREPLSEDKLDALAEANITDEGIAGYYLGFRDAEKAHGIGVLAQPEQTEQKPLTPRQGLEEYKRGYDKGWKACKYCYTNEELQEGVVGYLYKQMDCHGEWATIFKVDKPYITWHDIKDIVPVYTTQPKREPIEDGELKVWYSQHTWAMDEQEYTWGFRAYMAGCRDAEKAHGIIGGGE